MPLLRHAIRTAEHWSNILFSSDGLTLQVSAVISDRCFARERFAGRGRTSAILESSRVSRNWLDLATRAATLSALLLDPDL